jgi:hypothetical protein
MNHGWISLQDFPSCMKQLGMYLMVSHRSFQGAFIYQKTQVRVVRGETDKHP